MWRFPFFQAVIEAGIVDDLSGHGQNGSQREAGRLP
jgi:hypothetical protein